MPAIYDDAPPPAAFGPEPGWVHLNMPRSWGKGRSFVSGDTGDDRLRVWYYTDEREPRVLYAKVCFGPGAEGPPNHAHGGSMAAVLDEAMGFCAWAFGHKVVAASITINFQKRLPLEQVMVVRAALERVENTRVRTISRIYDPISGTQFATGEGLFVKQSFESFDIIEGVIRSQTDDPDS